MTLKILNLYCGIGGNRKLWSGDIEVTGVEIDPKIAKIYQDFFPNDKVIVGDAHQYLLEHFKEFDFIWSSPPCPSHSRVRIYSSVARGQSEAIFPSMILYEEILFLQYYFEGKYVVENVISYYDPLVKPQEFNRHYYWCNFPISKRDFGADMIGEGTIEFWEKKFGFDLSSYEDIDKRYMLRNCVDPKAGLHIFEMAFKKPQSTLNFAFTGEGVSK